MQGHFIITMFNLRMHWKGINKEIGAIDTATSEKYLSKRFELFEKYAVPSIKKQSKKILYGWYCFQKIPLRNTLLECSGGVSDILNKWFRYSCQMRNHGILDLIW